MPPCCSMLSDVCHTVLASGEFSAHLVQNCADAVDFIVRPPTYRRLVVAERTAATVKHTLTLPQASPDRLGGAGTSGATSSGCIRLEITPACADARRRCTLRGGSQSFIYDHTTLGNNVIVLAKAPRTSYACRVAELQAPAGGLPAVLPAPPFSFPCILLRDATRTAPIIHHARC